MVDLIVRVLMKWDLFHNCLHPLLFSLGGFRVLWDGLMVD